MPAWAGSHFGESEKNITSKGMT
jgi:hypothetical protein